MDQFKVTRKSAKGQPKSVVVNVSGQMTIQNIGEVKDALVKAFAEAEQLSLDLSGVTEIDLAGLQLLCAAHRSSLQMDKPVCFSSCNNEIVKIASTEAGFQRHVGCAQDRNKTCLWVGGKN